MIGIVFQIAVCFGAVFAAAVLGLYAMRHRRKTGRIATIPSAVLMSLPHLNPRAVWVLETVAEHKKEAHKGET